MNNLKVYFDCIGEYNNTANKEETIEAQNYYCQSTTKSHRSRVMKSLGLKEEDVEKPCTDILFQK